MKRYHWIASTKGPDGRAQDYLEGGFEEDASAAIERANEAVQRLSERGFKGWYVGVEHTQHPILSHNPPTYSYELIFFEEG